MMTGKVTNLPVAETPRTSPWCVPRNAHNLVAFGDHIFDLQLITRKSDLKSTDEARNLGSETYSHRSESVLGLPLIAVR
jgi:hypothetical protein